MKVKMSGQSIHLNLLNKGDLPAKHGMISQAGNMPGFFAFVILVIVRFIVLKQLLVSQG